jgi:hypothetical protein
MPVLLALAADQSLESRSAITTFPAIGWAIVNAASSPICC